MSSFYKIAQHPLTGEWGPAFYHDDFLGKHHYGIIFWDKHVADPWKVSINHIDFIGIETLITRYQQLTENIFGHTKLTKPKKTTRGK